MFYADESIRLYCSVCEILFNGVSTRPAEPVYVPIPEPEPLDLYSGSTPAVDVSTADFAGYKEWFDNVWLPSLPTQPTIDGIARCAHCLCL